MTKTPAILGGQPTFSEPFVPYLTIGQEEKDAVIRVMESGSLSGFIGAWVPQFYGGEMVKELEKNWCKRFKKKHAIAVNSATSGLYAAVGALGIEPGDEVIVTPTTMTATVTGIIVYQGIPVFADICPHTFCLGPAKVEKLITERTKAIIAVNIYGESANWIALREIAKKHNLKLIEDAAQSIGGMFNDKDSGTYGDIGIYSLNRHKHIHCGEGGVCVTDDDELAERLRLIRNHGEAVVEGMGTQNITNIIGFNYRMTELEAAVANEQLKKLDALVDKRIEVCNAIIKALKPFDGIISPVESPLKDPKSRPGLCRPADYTVKHIYYYLCFKLEKEKLGISRKTLVEALKAEGVPMGEGGYSPLYLQPMFQKKIAFGSKGYPFTAPYYGKSINYNRGLCPIAEKMWFEELFYFPSQSWVPSPEESARFAEALKKILKFRKEIEAKIGK